MTSRLIKCGIFWKGSSRLDRPLRLPAAAGALESAGEHAHISSAALRLAWRGWMDGERVDWPCKFLRKNLVDHAVPLDPAPPFKAPGNDIDPEMRLALRPVPGVPGVKMGLVDHPKALRLEGPLQLFLDARFDRHDAAIFLQPH
jgi:hypothetical protein